MVCAILVSAAIVTAEADEAKNSRMWLDEVLAKADEATVAAATDAAPTEAAEGTSRLPKVARRHTIEGVGGGLLVPTAYLANPGPQDEIFGMPAVSGTYMGGGFGRKHIASVAVSETLFGRVELSYAVSRLEVGNSNHVVNKTIATDLKDRGYWLHNFNIRGLLIEEDSFDLPLPAVTAGASFKYNENISDVNDRLFLGLDTVGYERSSGKEFTLSATKQFHLEPVPPLEVTVGVRHSEAAEAGFLGFTDHYQTTIEISVTAYPLEWMAITYEFRRRQQVYSDLPIPGMLRGEENWYAITVSLLPYENLTIDVGVVFFGNAGNQADAVGPSVSASYGW